MSLTTTTPRIYYEDRGSGEPLLMIVGFAASAASLEPLAALWSNRYRTIIYDHPGTGRSSKRSCPLSTAALAASAARLLDELEIDSAHVAGLSLGGVIAQELALRFPHRVRGLILIGTSTSGLLSTLPDPRKLALATARIAGASATRRRLWLAPAMFASDFVERHPDRAEALMSSLGAHPPPPWSLAGQYLAAGLHDSSLGLRRIRAPTLVLHGANDILVPASNADRLAEGIPDAELQILTGAGHGLPFELREQTFEIVGEWLSRRRPSAGDQPDAAAERTERVTRRLAVPLGALRFGRSALTLACRTLLPLRADHDHPQVHCR
jgi:pimeloyl-ACP methyl ester carboxylesterase